MCPPLRDLGLLTPAVQNQIIGSWHLEGRELLVFVVRVGFAPWLELLEIYNLC
jgi:hypothetical protein